MADENKLSCFGITQFLDPDYWEWTDAERQHIRDKDLEGIAAVIIRRLQGIGAVPKDMYGIIHDKDTRMVWNEKDKSSFSEAKPSHVHFAVSFGQPTETLSNIANAIGLKSQYVEKVGKGRYAYENLLSYLVHIKYTEKHQYSPEEVLTVCGRDYLSIFAERRVSWMQGRAKVNALKANTNIEYLEELILTGKVTKSQVLLTDEYFEVYSRNSRKCEDAFRAYGERRAYKTMEAMKNGEFKLSVLFLAGAAGSGKTRLAKALVDSLIEHSTNVTEEQWRACWTAASNPLDEYNGEEILLMDDVRGSSLSAADWLKLLDPYNISPGSARYKNKMPACRTIIITSTKEPVEFFYFCKDIGGGSRSEAMDQFLRRTMALVKVFHADKNSAPTVQITHPKPSEAYSVRVPNTDSERVLLNHVFESEIPGFEFSWTTETAVSMLTEEILRNNGIEPDYD